MVLCLLPPPSKRFFFFFKQLLSAKPLSQTRKKASVLQVRMTGTLAKLWGASWSFQDSKGHSLEVEFEPKIGASSRLQLLWISSSKTLIKYSRSLPNIDAFTLQAPNQWDGTSGLIKDTEELNPWAFLSLPCRPWSSLYPLARVDLRAFSWVSSHLLALFSFSIILNLIRCRLMRKQTGNQSKRFRGYWANWSLKKLS